MMNIEIYDTLARVVGVEIFLSGYFRQKMDMGRETDRQRYPRLSGAVLALIGLFMLDVLILPKWPRPGIIMQGNGDSKDLSLHCTTTTRTMKP